MNETLSQIVSVFKLRIGVFIMLSALMGLAATPGSGLPLWKVAVLALAVFLSSAAAGAFNQYMERDLDARMPRTAGRPFVTGYFKPGSSWLWTMGIMLVVPVAVTAWLFDPLVGIYLFLGAFTYGGIYTMWLKRRTSWNIVFGGVAGSFAVMAGATAINPGFSPIPLILAVVLFLWTPPHFWSLATAIQNDYAKAGVPMLPNVIGDKPAAQVIFAHTLTLSLLSLLPFYFGAGWIYLAGAAIGGIYFCFRSYQLMVQPSRETAMKNFFASLIQLTLLFVGVFLNAWIGI